MVVKVSLSSYDVYRLMGVDGTFLPGKEIKIGVMASDGYTVLAEPSPYFTKDNFEQTPYLMVPSINTNPNSAKMTIGSGQKREIVEIKTLARVVKIKLFVSRIDEESETFEYFLAPPGKYHINKSKQEFRV